MKKILVCLSVLTLVIATAGSSSAMLLKYVERFDQNIKLSEGDRAIFKFNLTDVGGQAFHVDSDGTRTAFGAPTVDETSFDKGYTVESAHLRFKIGGLDKGKGEPDERIKIRVTGESDGGTTLFNEFVSLGVDTFNFDLAPGWLVDGMLRTVAIALAKPDGIKLGKNDFKIKSAQLSVKAIPNPEPATIILLSSGLIGLAVYSRKKYRKK